MAKFCSLPIWSVHLVRLILEIAPIISRGTTPPISVCNEDLVCFAYCFVVFIGKQFFAHKFFIVQLMHTKYIEIRIIKTTKIITVAPTCFGLCKPSSGSHKQYLAKITLMFQIYMLLWTYSVLWRHLPP
jgi:hypothetical protein